MGAWTWALVAVLALAVGTVPLREDFDSLVSDPETHQHSLLLPLHTHADEVLGTAFAHPSRVTSYNYLVVFALATSDGWAHGGPVSHTWLGVFNVWIPFPIDMLIAGAASLIGAQKNLEVHEFDVAAWEVLLATNILVFLLWKALPRSFMQENFATSVNEGLRLWTWPTASFSHESFFHLAHNMLIFYQIAPILEFKIGSKQLCVAYITCGAVGSFFSLAKRTFGPQWGHYSISLGASGAVMGLLTLFALLFPDERFVVFGTIPVSALAFVGLHALLDIFLHGATVDVPCHLGGIFAALFVLPGLGFNVSLLGAIEDILPSLQRFWNTTA